MPENVYFVAGAYVVMWATVLGYLLRLRAQLARARTQLEHARRAGGDR